MKGAADPVGWKGGTGGGSQAARFAEFLSGRQLREQVGIGVRDVRLLAPIRLSGLRVSLVVGPSGEHDDSYSDKSLSLPPLGVIQLGSMLSAHGARVAVKDFFASPGWSARDRAVLSDLKRLQARAAGAADPGLSALVSRLAAELLADRPAVVGLSALTQKTDSLVFLLLQRALRRRAGAPRVAVGGSFCAAGLSEAQLAEFDFVVEGEGEVPLLLICAAVAEGRDPGRVPGLCRFSADGGPARRSKLTHSLDLLPPPDLAGLDLSAYRAPFPGVLPGRTVPYRFVVGCPNRCSYCNIPDQGRYRLRSAPLVVRDLERLQGDFGVQRFFFLNSAINTDPRYNEALLDAMLARRRTWGWIDCARPRPCGPAYFRRMRRAGCEALTWGLDTSSPRLNARYRRALPREDFARLLRSARAAGISNGVNVVVGLPFETDRDIDGMLSFLRRQAGAIDRLYVFEYQFVPHSDMGLHPDRYGLRLCADGQGVDEIGGLSWTRRLEWRRSALARVRELASEIGRPPRSAGQIP